MIILDCNRTEKNAISLKVVTYEVKDSVNKGAVPTEFVEAVIKGKHRRGTWVEYYPLATFRRLNPGVEL